MNARYYSVIFAIALLVAGFAYLFLSTAEPACYQDLVCDTPGIFSAKEIDQLSLYHSFLRKKYDIDYRVFVIKNVDNISSESVQIFRKNQIGSLSKDRKGLLLLIDPVKDNVRLEVSAGLDAVYTDGFVSYLQRNQMIPFFKDNRIADGILATTEMIVMRARDATEGKEFIAPEQLPQTLGIGAGAQAEASIGTGYTAPTSANNVNVTTSGMTPGDVVAAYHQVLRDNNFSPDLEIYAKKTREWKRNFHVTPAQYANELSLFKKCQIEDVYIFPNKKQAVVRYRLTDNTCAPYFLVMEDGAWRLDFVTMFQTIKFNFDNQWRFTEIYKNPYIDAFDIWAFDANGFPILMPQYTQQTCKPPYQDPHCYCASSHKKRWGTRIISNDYARVTMVAEICPGSFMDQAGFQFNDIILNWNGLYRPDQYTITDAMDRLVPGQTFKVKIWRNGLVSALLLTAPPSL